MRLNRTALTLIATVIFATAWSGSAWSATDGRVVVRVVTEPPHAGDALRFSGKPTGQIRLDATGTGTLGAGVGSGRHVSTLVSGDSMLLSAGYRLVGIACDDATSQRASHGDPAAKSAIFEVEDGETVTCVFRYAKDDLREDSADPPEEREEGEGEEDAGHTGAGTTCLCPKAGNWHVDNHAGQMACSGAMSIMVPLPAQRGRGTLSPGNGCATVLASGMSDDEADIQMHRQPDCSYVGTVGGSRDGIPMTITFRWNVESRERITGDLGSTVVQPGMTCKMVRTYELDFGG